ncbi:uncharacterized protein DNG_09234 [Cephalotrichum gorgonifer]|uniref:PhyH domain-containing protein n=1 Tax=Cephalotrichum gorgonifer TaxID=2041049 RepID=A0AAE8N6W9_9PEZI|nr:uncharacterized protein DNG_09234 [Cephalotrichum gorgonifer]
MTPPSLVIIDASEPIEKINEIIARDGGVIVSNFLPLDVLNKAVQDVEHHFASRKIFQMNATSKAEMGANFFPKGTQRVYGLLGKMPDLIISTMRLKVWQGIMDHFLSDTCYSYTGDTLVPQKSGYMLASTAALRLAPGAQPQLLHRDYLKFQTRPDPSNPLFTPMLGCLIAGSNCTYKNGATAVIPGSHLWGPDRIPKKEECTYAEMAPGSALFTLGATYHGAGENTCEPTDPDAIRTMFAVFGQRDYFRADQDEAFSTPLEVVRKLPEDILRLSGFYKSVGGCGYVGDHQHPAEFIHEENLSTAEMLPCDTNPVV